MALTGIGRADVVLPGVVTGRTVAFPGVVRCVVKDEALELLRVVKGGVVRFPGVDVTLTGVIRVAVVTTVVLPDVLKEVVTLSPEVEDEIEAFPDVVTGGFVTGVGWLVAFPGVETGGFVVLAAVVADAGGVVS